MKVLIITACAVLLLVIFLPCAADECGNREPPALIWRDASTGNVLFTSDDIISFDWDKQMFLLKRDATLDFLAWIPPHMYQARGLFVEDAHGQIYHARWVSRVSSVGFFGPVYRPLSPNPFFSVAHGYPGGRDPLARDKDPRFSPRLKQGLQKAGVLKSINLSGEYAGLTIQKTGHSWKDIGEDMRVRVEYFENTFQIGEHARAHVFFAGGDKTLERIDSLTFDITFIANEGAFRSDTRIERVPVSEIRDGIYVCKFAPWQPVEGSDREAKPGAGVILLSILLRSQGKTVYRLDFAESRVPVN